MDFVGAHDVFSAASPAESAVDARGCVAGSRVRAVVCMLGMALVALAARAGWENQLGPDLFGAQFKDYAPGEVLSDKDALNGTWGEPALPPLANASATNVNGRTYMRCSTADEGIVFSPTTNDVRELKSVVATVLLASFEELPKLTSDMDRTGFSIYRPTNHTEAASFQGWSKDGWQRLTLASGKVLPKMDWCTVSIRLAKDDLGTLLVQYRLGVGKDENGDDVFEPLYAEVEGGRSYWLEAGGGSGPNLVNAVEFRGEGGLDCFSGREPYSGLVTGVGVK